MASEARAVRPPRRLATWALVLLLSLAGTAFAHATLVFGTVTSEPSPPPVGEPFTIRLELTDPTGTAVEDAVVNVEADPQEAAVGSRAATNDAEGAGDGAEAASDAGADPADAADGEANGDAAGDPPLVTSDRFVEVEPGFYETEVVLPRAGPWTLTFRDRTFRQEEAVATITMRVGADAGGEPLSFIFPPTATGPQSLTTWLVWLIGLPVVAGAVVTAMVLRGGGDAAEDEDAGPNAEGSDRA